MDVKAKIDELVEKIKNDDKLLEKFRSDPVKTLEGMLGVDLPDEQLKQLADGVKAKINLDKLGGALGGLFGKK